MSKQNPVISVIGSSGAGTTSVKRAFEKIFNQKKLKVVVIEGDSFHKFERSEMKTEIAKSIENGGRVLTHFSNKANHFDRLAELFDNYGKNGTGQKRYYIHSDESAVEHNARLGTNLKSGQFTPWEDVESGTDIMFYEGLHGGITEVADKVDLLVGVAPTVNIEWIQKIHRDTTERPYSPQDVHKVILDRMPDYAEFITPQFDNTHINFHRIPLIDTANPFSDQAKTVPAPEDSLVVTTVKIDGVDLEGIKNQLPADAMAFLQNENTLIYKGNYMIDVLDLMLGPVIETLINNK